MSNKFTESLMSCYDFNFHTSDFNLTIIGAVG
jgi:hypothetical protein